MRIVETDNFGGDYPNEAFLNVPLVDAGRAQNIADAINMNVPTDYPRFWRVVPNEYVLRKGFTP